MKRILSLPSVLLLSSVATALLLSTTADAAIKAGVLYIPADTITITPSGMDVCNSVSMGDYNSGLGCDPNLGMARDVAAHADAATLATDAATALAPYDVFVTNTRPPEFLPYFMLFPSDDTVDESLRHSCTRQFTGCAGRARDLIGFTNGGTMNCMDPDTLQTVLYAFGRMSGLEGSSDAAGAMHYPPDFVVPAAAYTDQCVTLVQQLGGDDGMTMLPLDCTSADHEGGDCMAGEQNAHQDLLAYFGDRTDDTDAPEIEVGSPADGDMIEEGGELLVSVTLTDASLHLGVMIKVESPSLDIIFEADPNFSPLFDGSLSACTSGWCDTDYLEGDPFRENDAPWELPLPGLPGGEYTITIGAADYHGNVAEEIVMTVTIGGDPPMESTTGAESDSDTDGGSDTDSGSETNPSTTDPTASDTNMTFVSDSNGSSESDTEDEDDDGGTGQEMGDDDSGCACTAGEGAGGAMALLLGLFGFGLARRRNA